MYVDNIFNTIFRLLDIFSTKKYFIKVQVGVGKKEIDLSERKCFFPAYSLGVIHNLRRQRIGREGFFQMSAQASKL